MAIAITTGAPTLFIRRAAYESSGLSRSALDERLGLTADEFRVEGNLVVVGPIYGEGGQALEGLVAELEGLGLTYFDDFFELSGNWPEWPPRLGRLTLTRVSVLGQVMLWRGRCERPGPKQAVPAAMVAPATPKLVHQKIPFMRLDPERRGIAIRAAISFG